MCSVPIMNMVTSSVNDTVHMKSGVLNSPHIGKCQIRTENAVGGSDRAVPCLP